MTGEQREPDGDAGAAVVTIADLIRRPLTVDEIRDRGMEPPEDGDPIVPERVLTLAEAEAIVAATNAGARSLSEFVDALRASAPALAAELAPLSS